MMTKPRPIQEWYRKQYCDRGCTVSNLSNGVTYTFTVRAETSLGAGDPATMEGKPVPDDQSVGESELTITEDGETPAEAEVTATLSNPSMEAITVTVEVDDAALATVADATIEFAAEATTSTDVATVTAVDNPLDEDNTVEVTATSDNATAPAAATDSHHHRRRHGAQSADRLDCNTRSRWRSVVLGIRPREQRLGHGNHWPWLRVSRPRHRW